METIQLSIPNMKSSHCMMVVTEAMKSVSGATLKKINPSQAEIELSGATRATVVQAIERAGYTVANK